jgi:type II secretory pathway component PulC
MVVLAAVLQGVLLAVPASSSLAIVREAGATRVVRVGESLGGVRVVAISSDALRLADGRRLYLWARSRPPAALTTAVASSPLPAAQPAPAVLPAAPVVVQAVTVTLAPAAPLLVPFVAFPPTPPRAPPCASLPGVFVPLQPRAPR